MSLDTDLSLLLLWAVTDSDSNSTERMSALKANDGWCLSQVMSPNQPYVILTGRQALRLFCLELRLHILFMSRYCRINLK